MAGIVRVIGGERGEGSREYRLIKDAVHIAEDPSLRRKASHMLIVHGSGNTDHHLLLVDGKYYEKSQRCVLQLVHKRPGRYVPVNYNVVEDHVEYRITDVAGRSCRFLSGDKDYFDDLVAGRWRLVVDERYPTDEEEVDNVIVRARSLVGTGSYHLPYDSCEHFVTELLREEERRFRVENSHQTGCLSQ